jgi:hypothetical protein
MGIDSLTVRHHHPPVADFTLRGSAKVVSHAKYMVFQRAEVTVPGKLFAAIMERIGRLRLACASG